MRRSGYASVAMGRSGRAVAVAVAASIALAAVALGATGGAPVLGRSAAVERVAGTVLLRRPGSHRFTRLRAGRLVALGTTVDASAGTVRVTSATTAPGQTQSATFRGGQFRLTQDSSGSTLLTLNAPLRCPGPHHAPRARAARDRVVRHAAATATRKLWGDGSGQFTTIGRDASATVLGTRWKIVDSCGGTQVTVVEGEVRVTNRATGQTSTLTSGATYTAGFVLTSLSYPLTVPSDTYPDVDISWAGDPTFPVTATDTPNPGCSTSTFKCGSGTVTFAAPTQPLVWSRVDWCSLNGAPSHTGSWSIYLTDATGRRTDPVVLEQHCVAAP